jgi:FlaA1/EpsC-like NDP-sugar epimerase
MEEKYCLRQEHPKAAYQEIQPQKGYLDGECLKNLTFSLDLKLILLTALLVFVPGKAEPATLRFFGLEIRPYSRAAQMAAEALLFAMAAWLAYWLRFEGALSDIYRFQAAAFVVLLPAFRVGANAVFGVYSMIWRYVNLVDATILVLSFSLVSAILVALRLLLPSENSIAHVFQIPLGVIVMEFLLELGRGLGLRALRRVLYEMDHRYQPLPVERRQRILIFGAGLSGLGIALEITRYPHLQLVGFIDDDLAKQGCLIAGYSVLAASEKLPAIIPEQQVGDIIICVGSVSSQVLRRIQQDCCLQGVKTYIIPTLEEIPGENPAGGPRAAS